MGNAGDLAQSRGSHDPQPTATQALRPSIGRIGGRVPRVLGWGWPAAIVIVVLYGSCLPFDFNRSTTGVAFSPLSIQLCEAGYEDIATNLLVYFPIGLSIALCLRSSSLARVAATTAIGACVSLTIETLQTGLDSRVASWIDVLLNTAGAGAGGAVGVALHGVAWSWLDRLRIGLGTRPFATMASLLAVGLLFFRLAPFDFITTTTGLRDALLRAGMGMQSATGSSMDVHPSPAAYAHLIKPSIVAAWFAALGYLLALAERETGRRRVNAMASAWQNATILLIVIELVQLFTRSHIFDMASVMIGSLAAAFGAYVAIFIVDAYTRSAWKHTRRNTEGTVIRPGLAVPTLVLVVVAMYQLFAVLAATIDPQLTSGSGVSLSRFHWLPFEALWRGSMTGAAVTTASTLITYAMLALTLGIIVRRIRGTSVRRNGQRRIWLITGTAVVLLAFVLELLQTATPARTADLTTPILAIVSVALAARVHTLLRPWAIPVASDGGHAQA